MSLFSLRLFEQNIQFSRVGLPSGGGVVFMKLDRLALEWESVEPANGRVLFPGEAAVVFQGPATVELDAGAFRRENPHGPQALLWLYPEHSYVSC